MLEHHLVVHAEEAQHAAPAEGVVGCGRLDALDALQAVDARQVSPPVAARQVGCPAAGGLPIVDGQRRGGVGRGVAGLAYRGEGQSGGCDRRFDRVREASSIEAVCAGRTVGDSGFCRPSQRNGACRSRGEIEGVAVGAQFSHDRGRYAVESEGGGRDALDRFGEQDLKSRRRPDGGPERRCDGDDPRGQRVAHPLLPDRIEDESPHQIGTGGARLVHLDRQRVGSRLQAGGRPGERSLPGGISDTPAGLGGRKHRAFVQAKALDLGTVEEYQRPVVDQQARDQFDGVGVGDRIDNGGPEVGRRGQLSSGRRQQGRLGAWKLGILDVQHAAAGGPSGAGIAPSRPLRVGQHAIHPVLPRVDDLDQTIGPIGTRKSRIDGQPGGWAGELEGTADDLNGDRRVVIRG